METLAGLAPEESPQGLTTARPDELASGHCIQRKTHILARGPHGGPIK